MGDIIPQDNNNNNNNNNNNKHEEYLPKEKEFGDDWFETPDWLAKIDPEKLKKSELYLGPNWKSLNSSTNSKDCIKLLHSKEPESEPYPCPKFVVSPWLQSSCTPDKNLKSLFT
jgi:hypothetical protein